MRVIFNAKTAPWRKICNCDLCHSRLEVVASDLSFIPDSRDGNAYKFTCPVCQHEIWIAASLVPEGVVSK